MFGGKTGDAVRDKEVRVKHDRKRVQKALADVPDTDVPVAVVCLGKPELTTYPRSVKLIFSNTKTALNILNDDKR